MKKIRILSLILAIACFSVFGISILINDQKNISNQIEGKDYPINNQAKETINKEDKIGINTKIEKIHRYIKCSHDIKEKINIENNLLNKNYNELQNIFPNYYINEFNNKNIVLLREFSTYCPEHFVLKELDGKIAIYTQIDENEENLYEILDIDINNLRENDKKLFKENGFEIYGRRNLYQIIEDFNS